MYKYAIKIIGLSLFLFSTVVLAQTVSDDNLKGEEETGVTIELTKFDVNDAKLEVSWKIINGSDHDVWICDGVVFNGSELEFESFIDRDGETFLIRKRFNVPTLILWYALPEIEGRFIRLQAGRQRSETLSLDLPVHLQPVFKGFGPTVKHAKRLLLEIGFFNEDLPELIRSILRVAEKLNCAQLPRQDLSSKDQEILSDYFRGIDISELFGGLSGFNQSYPDVNENITLPYMWWPEGGIKGEQTIQIIIEDVSIPIYKQNGNDMNEDEDVGIKMVLTKFDVNDTNLELCYQIRNDSENDIWICKYIDVFGGPGSYEVYTTIDGQALVMRRRLEALEGCWYVPPQSRYVCLRPGENRIESLSFTLPIEYRYEYSGNEGYATRLIVEVGYYPGDLPGMIRDILDVAEKMNWNRLYHIEYDHRIVEQYFTGLRIAQWFGGSLPGVNNEIGISWMGETRLGEQALQFTIDGVRIPYKLP